MEFVRLIRSPAWLRHDKNGITQRILRATDGRANPETGLLAEHKEGKHKARVFAAALELEADDAEWLREELLEIAKSEDCQLGRKNDYGQRYLIEFELSHGRKTARVRRIWIIRTGENFPRLVTCYVV
jgi:hypothetical protein